MAYLKIIFLFILMMMDRCGIIPRQRFLKGQIGPGTARPLNTGMNGSWRPEDPKIRSITVKSVPDSLTGENVKVEKDPDFLLSFFPDSSFTEINERGEYAVGKWKYDHAGQRVSMMYPDSIKIYTPTFSDKNGLRQVLLVAPSGDSLLLAGFGKSMENYRNDPFYANNNGWRTKSGHTENKKEIRTRLVGYVGHVTSLLKAAETRRQTLISWEFSRGIIKIYNGGIGIVPRDQIPDIWVQSFYSRAEALLAYDMFLEYLRSTSYKVPPTGNWVQDDYLILEDILSGLKRTA